MRLEGIILEDGLPRREQITYLGEGKVCLLDQGYGETI